MNVYVPNDSTAAALGADAVAEAVEGEAKEQRVDLNLIRNGSRGLYWAEPMIEIEIDGSRQAFGPVSAKDVKQLFKHGLANPRGHPSSLGDIDKHPYLRDQHRLTFARAGRNDPLEVTAYRHNGGLRGLERALSLSAQQIIDDISASGLRGRGGAAFPAGRKLQAAAQAPGDSRYVVCNADEGDAGTFADRLLMESDPLQLIEGMTIAALAIGASTGYVYLRSEYPRTAEIFSKALLVAREARLLGSDILGSSQRFDIELRIGAGAYICGEETSLLESIEGRRAEVRTKPPLPVHHGLFNAPTVVNNVLTLAAMTSVLADGADAYYGLGTGESHGTQPFQLAGNIARGGLVEAPFGISLRTLVEDFGGGTASGRPIKAVQTGGPLGKYLSGTQLDVAMDYDALARGGGLLGHGGIIVFDDTVDMAEQAQFAMKFCAAESCGKCTPCRIGSVRGVEIIERIRTGKEVRNNLELLDSLCDTMESTSLCAMGSMTPNPVRSALLVCPEDFGQ